MYTELKHYQQRIVGVFGCVRWGWIGAGESSFIHAHFGMDGGGWMIVDAHKYRWNDVRVHIAGVVSILFDVFFFHFCRQQLPIHSSTLHHYPSACPFLSLAIFFGQVQNRESIEVEQGNETRLLFWNCLVIVLAEPLPGTIMAQVGGC